MIVTERLKSLAQKRGLSQAELARRVGLQQSTVNLLFTGKSRTTSRLRAIARVLRTSQEYLEGEVDEPDNFAGESPISEEELGWLDLLNAVPETERGALLALARSLAGNRVSRAVQVQHGEAE